MEILILVSDTNIFIDIEEGNLTSLIFQLPYEIAVSDFLYESELKEHYSHLLQAGLKVKSLTHESVKHMERLTQSYPRPSILDHSALALAMQEKCSLLTGDKDLRLAAKNEGIEVHGTIWLVEQLLNLKMIQQRQAKESFDVMKVKGRRLPWGDVDKLLSLHLIVVEND